MSWKKPAAIAAGVLVVGGVTWFAYKQFAAPKASSGPTKPAPSPQKPMAAPSATPGETTLGESLDAKEAATKAAQLKKLGNDAYRARDYDRALKTYSEALDICPPGQDRAILYSNRSAVYLFQKNYDAVISDCSKAIGMKPGYTRAWSRRAQAHESLGHHVLALKDYTVIALMTDLKDQKASNAIDRLLTSLGKKKAIEFLRSREHTLPPQRIVQNYFSNFSEGSFGKQVDESVDTIRARLAEDPQNGETMVALVLALLKTHEYTESWELVRKTVDRLQEMDLTPTRKVTLSNMLNVMSCFQLLSLDYAEAEQTLRKALRFDKDNSNTLTRLGACLIELSKSKEAMESFKQASKLDPKNPDVYFHLAQGEIAMGAGLMAFTNLEKSIKLGCKLYNAYVSLAIVKMQQGNFQEAIETMKTACDKFPESANVQLYLGEFYFQNGYNHEAEDCFSKALEIDPNSGTAYVYQGMLKIHNGNPAGGVALLKKALEVEPTCDTAHVRLAQFHTQKEEYDEALKCYDSAIKCTYSASELITYFSCKIACETQRDALKEHPNLKPPSQDLKNF